MLNVIACDISSLGFVFHFMINKSNSRAKLVLFHVHKDRLSFICTIAYDLYD